MSVLALLLLTLGGCWRGCTSSRPPIHPNPNMDIQPKYRAQSASAFFYDGATMRPPVEGTVARGELHEDTAFHTGLDEAGAFVAQIPQEVDESFVLRGQERYDIYCAPCHHERGNGRGILFERAQIPTADLHQERLVAMPDGQMFDVITNGLGLMSGYKYPIPPEDRWAIIAYVRRLQSEAGS
ncbi:MAG: cytochrome c [bacterium]|nr:cytochrome c [bacterium]